MLGAGLVLAWRSLVCLSIAPWAGFMLAFASAEVDKVWAYVLLCIYFALSIFLVYVLAMTFRQVVSDSKRFQRYLDAQALQERQQLLITAGNYRQDDQHIDGDALNEHEVE